MNSPETVTANFSNNVLTVCPSVLTACTSTTPTVTRGGSSTAHSYYGSSTASSGTTYNDGYGSDGTTLGSFSCYSIIDQMDVTIYNIINSGGTVEFLASFSGWCKYAPGDIRHNMFLQLL